jgi:hypothetical protein
LVDYETYAEGEALLGWFNGTCRLSGAAPFDGNIFLLNLAGHIRHALGVEQLEIAHFKMTLMPDDDIGDLAVLNLVSSDREPELGHRLQDDLVSGELIMNLRAEGDPEILQRAVRQALATETARAGIIAEVVHMEHFRPARPSPTYRMATVEG